VSLHRRLEALARSSAPSRQQRRIAATMAAGGLSHEDAEGAVARAAAALRPYGEAIDDAVLLHIIRREIDCDPEEALERLRDARVRLAVLNPTA
jgi:hypothetical protein